MENVSESTAGTAKGASQNGGSGGDRADIESGIVRALKRIPYGRLKAIEALTRSETGRVFAPRSAHGMSLFNRLQDVDAVFSRCEQRVMREATSMASFDTKMALERRMFELNSVLVEFVAEMAIDYGVEDASREKVIVTKINELKDERAQKESEQSSVSKESKRKQKDALPDRTVIQEIPALSVVDQVEA